MIEGMPWSVKGVEPEIRDDALHAAHSSGLTLGQWLNGVIRDSLVDLKAARGAGPRITASPFMQQETARQTMQHYPAQQPYPYAPMPQMMGQPMMPPAMMQPGMMQPGMMPPPYAMPPAMAYPQAYPSYPAPMPAAPAYDPFEARLRQYGRTETAVGSVPGADQRMLSVIDAAVDSMQHSVRASEQKTAAAIEKTAAAIDALATLVDQSRTPGQAAPQAAAAPRPRPSDAEQVSRTLSVLVERLASLEKNLADGETRRTEDVTSQARRLEDRIGEALDTLARDMSHKSAPAEAAPAQPAVAPHIPAAPAAISPAAPEPLAVRLPPVTQPRPRPAMQRTAGANAIAEIAARQRMLDADEEPRALGQVETSALDAIKRSIAALADQVREQRPATAATPAAEFDMRSELRDLQKSVEELAPRQIVASVNDSIRALAQKIEQSRQEGVRESQLAPIEKLLTDMRVSMESMREPRALSAMMRTLEQLASRVEIIGAKSIDNQQLSDLQRQFGDLRSALSEARQHQPADALQDQIARLGTKLDSLIESPRDSKIVNLVAEAVEDVRKNLRRFDPDRLFARIEERLSGLDAMEARFAALSERIEATRQAPADQGGLDSITRQIERMTRSLAERSAAPDLSQIVERIDDMRAALAAKPVAVAPDLSSLEQRIADIQSSLHQRPAQPDIKGLELILRKLADRIETVRAPAANGASLDALQSQVVALAERLERNGSSVPALDGMERTLSDLVNKVGSLKETTVSAAKTAAREAMAHQPAMGMDPLAAEGMILIKRDLTEMKSVQAEAEAKSRETLQLVNTTLEKIVSRLATMESELSRPRAAAPMPQPAPVDHAQPQAFAPQALAPQAMAPQVMAPQVLAPQPVAANTASNRPAPSLARSILSGSQQNSAPPVAPASRMAAPAVAAPVAHADDAHDADLPLEPGAGRNGPVATGPGEAPASNDPRSSFIAAARRAAQAAAAQTSAVLSEIDEKNGIGKKQASTGEGRLAGVKTFIAQRRKPLLLGLAALVFALGGLKVATNFMQHDDPVSTGSIGGNDMAPEASDKSAGASVTKSSSAFEPGSPMAKRQAAAEALIAAAPVSKLPSQALDTSVVGSVGGDKALGTAPIMPQAMPSAPVAPASPATPDSPAADIPSLFKSAPFTGPERLKQAATGGNLAAIYEIGARLAEGRGTARDLKAAAGWLDYAAAQGYAPAQYRLGSFSREGLGVPKDAKKAFGWFQRAAEQGHILAMHNLAVLYAEGVNGSPDYASAASWFRTAGEYGVKDSQFNIAILHVRGLGVAQDTVEAYKWFSAAAAQGDADAVKKRDELAARMTPDKLAEAKAVVENFRAKKPDVRANDVAVPEGGWDQVAKAAPAPAPAAGKKTRI